MNAAEQIIFLHIQDLNAVLPGLQVRESAGVGYIFGGRDGM